MTVRRPLTFNSGGSTQGMRQIADSEMALLRYNLAVAYADSINGGIGSIGAVSTGTGKVDIFSPGGSSVTDTKRTQVTTSNSAGGSAAEDWPAYSGPGTSVHNQIRWQQNFDTQSSPSNSTLNSTGWLYYVGDNYNFRYVSNETDVVDTIISDTISEMRTVHSVGTYYVATGAPFHGGNGTWTDKGVVFTDTTYSAGSTTYRLYLKRNLSDTSSVSGNAPIYRWGSSPQGFRQIDVGTGGGLIQNILLPYLKRKIAGSGQLQYKVATSSSGLARGTMIDKRQESYSQSRSYSSPNYTSTRTPSGGTSNITTYYFQMI